MLGRSYFGKGRATRIKEFKMLDKMLTDEEFKAVFQRYNLSQEEKILFIFYVSAKYGQFTWQKSERLAVALAHCNLVAWQILVDRGLANHGSLLRWELTMNGQGLAHQLTGDANFTFDGWVRIGLLLRTITNFELRFNTNRSKPKCDICKHVLKNKTCKRHISLL